MKKKEENKRKKAISFSFTPIEIKKIKANAKKLGHENASRFLAAIATDVNVIEFVKMQQH